MRRKNIIIPTIIIVISVIINILARLVSSFANFYVQKVYGIVTTPFRRIANLFSFSIGELLIYLAVFLTLIALFSLAILLINVFRKKIGSGIKKYLLVYYWILSIVCLVMTLNCFVLYQVETMDSEIYVKYSNEELAEYRDYLVEYINELSLTFERDANGYLIDNKSIKDELISQSVKEMTRLSEKEGFIRLKGEYSYPKSLWLSGFFSKQHIMGYFFPFSMESNYNNIMYIANIPFTVCHELAHQKGYILEDEANYIAYKACLNSEDEYINYCGLLGIFNYVNNDFYYSIDGDKEVYLSHIQTNDFVKMDNIFLTDDMWKQINNKGLDTELVHKVSNEFTDTVLKSNGVDDGINSYSRVVKLLLNDYYGNKNVKLD